MSKEVSPPEEIDFKLKDKNLIYLVWVLSGERTSASILRDALFRYLTTPSVMKQIGLELREMDYSREEIVNVLTIFASPFTAGRVASEIFGGEEKRGLNHLLHAKRKEK